MMLSVPQTCHVMLYNSPAICVTNTAMTMYVKWGTVHLSTATTMAEVQQQICFGIETQHLVVLLEMNLHLQTRSLQQETWRMAQILLAPVSGLISALPEMHSTTQGFDLDN